MEENFNDALPEDNAMQQEEETALQEASENTKEKAGRHYKEEPSKPSVLKQIWWFLRPTVICCAIVLFLVFFIFIYAVVPSGSMENTIMTGSYIIANRRAYDNAKPMRGDVVVFETDQNESKMLVKRVVATEGERVQLIDGDVYINGAKLSEPYVVGKTWGNLAGDDFLVPEGCVLVMGDNREDSADARYWNNPYLPVSNIKGRVFVTFSFRHFYIHKIDKGSDLLESYGEVPTTLPTNLAAESLCIN